MRLHENDPENRKRAWKVWSEGPQLWIIQTVQKFFLDSDPTQLEALVVGTAADLIPSATRKLTRAFLQDEVEEKEILLSGKVQALMERSAETKKENTSKPGKQEKDGEEDHRRGEEHFPDK